MADLIFFLFLLVCGTAYAHFRISKWKSKYRLPAFVINLILPVIYLPFVMKEWWRIDSLESHFFLFFSDRVFSLIILALAPFALAWAYYTTWKKAKRHELPKIIVRLLWPSYCIALICIALMIVWIVVIQDNPFFIPQVNNLQIYISRSSLYQKLAISAISVIIILILNECFFAYVGLVIEIKYDRDYLKVLKFFRKYVLGQDEPLAQINLPNAEPNPQEPEPAETGTPEPLKEGRIVIPDSREN